MAEQKTDLGIASKLDEVKVAHAEAERTEQRTIDGILQDTKRLIESGGVTVENSADLAIAHLYQRRVLEMYERIAPAWRQLMAQLTAGPHFLLYERVSRPTTLPSSASQPGEEREVVHDSFALGCLKNGLPVRFEGSRVLLNHSSGFYYTQTELPYNSTLTHSTFRQCLPQLTLGERHQGLPPRDNVVEDRSHFTFYGIRSPLIYEGSVLCERRVFSAPGAIATFLREKPTLFVPYRSACAQAEIEPIDPPTPECEVALKEERERLRREAHKVGLDGTSYHIDRAAELVELSYRL